MNKGKTLLGTLCIALVVGLTTGVVVRSRSGSGALDKPQAGLQAKPKDTAALVDMGHTKGWTGKDVTRLAAIKPNQPVSDADFRQAMRTLDLKKMDKNSQLGAVTMTVSALVAAVLSPSQQASLAQAALPLLSMNDPVYNNGDIEEYACKVFVKYPNGKAVPRLHALLSSPHPWVRRDAARALVASGENVSVPPRPKTW